MRRPTTLIRGSRCCVGSAAGPAAAAHSNRSRAAVVLAAAMLAISLASCSSGSDSTTPVYEGTEVDGLEGALTQAEGQLAGVAENNAGVVGDDARCWAEAGQPLDGEVELTGNAMCGPVLFPTSDPDRFFVVFGLDLEVEFEGDDGRAVPGEPALTSESATVELDRTKTYLRPDGDEVPDATDLELPPPPPAEADLVGFSEPSTPLDAPEDARLIGAPAEVQVNGIGTVETVKSVGTLYGPPEGGELFAIDLILGEETSLVRNLTIEVGGESRVDLLAETPPDGPIVMAVQEGESIELVLEEDKAVSVDPTSEPISQTYDLRTGTVVDPVEVYYRNREGNPIKTVDIPCEYEPDDVTPSEPCTERFFGPLVSLEHTVRVDSASQIDTDFLEAPRDGAILVVDSLEGSARLLLADGTEVPPSNELPDAGKSTDRWLFLVPADFETGTLITNSTGGEFEIGSVPEGALFPATSRGIDHETEITIPQ